MLITLNLSLSALAVSMTACGVLTALSPYTAFVLPPHIVFESEIPPADPFADAFAIFAEGAAGLLPAGAGGSGPLMLRKQIADTLQSNPEEAKQLFVSWLEEEGG